MIMGVRLIHSLILLRPSAETLWGFLGGVQVFTLATPVASNGVSLIGRGVTTSSKVPSLFYGQTTLCSEDSSG